MARAYASGRGSRPPVIAVIAVIAVALLAACGSAGPAATGPAGTTPSSAATGSPPAATPTSFQPSLTPVPAPTPSPPGVVALALEDWGDTGGLGRSVTVYEDGRVVQSVRQADQTAVLMERTLSPSGLASLREDLKASGLFDAGDRVVRPVPVGCCGGGEAIVLVDAGRRVRVSAYANRTTAPEAARFDELATLLRGLQRWDEAGAWADSAPYPYTAAAFRLRIWHTPMRMDAEARPPHDVADVAWPPQVPIETFGRPLADDPTSRCGVVPLATIRLLVMAIAGAGVNAPSERNATDASFTFDWAKGDGTVYVGFEPLLPDGVAPGNVDASC